MDNELHEAILAGSPVDDLIHERWERMTDGGKTDGRVHDIMRDFDEFWSRLRARYNPPDTAERALAEAREHVLRHAKRQIVLEVHPRGYSLRGDG